MSSPSALKVNVSTSDDADADADALATRLWTTDLLAVPVTLDERAVHFGQRCWNEDSTFVAPKKIAEWLGRGDELNVAALKVYMAKFDFGGLKLDQAFRRLCEKLYLKAESQQLDRILEQFGARYHDMNPSNVYASADAVHAVSYSLLMLNTDLHVVSHQNRMTQAQFIDNTMAVVKSNQKATDDAAAAAELTQLPNLSSLFGPGTPLAEEPTPTAAPAPASAAIPSADNNSTLQVSTPTRKPISRRLTNASISSAKEAVSAAMASAASLGSLSGKANDGEGGLGTPSRSGTRSRSGSTVNNAQRRWEHELETALKEVYQSIKRDAIMQPLSSQQDSPEVSRSSLNLPNGNSPYSTWGPLGRNGSKRSITPAASGSLSTGTVNSGAYKRASVWAFGNFLGPTSSSMELTRSTSPTPSTSTSFSDDPQHSKIFNHSANTIGFANNLSHTIIKEQHEDDLMPKLDKEDDAVSISSDDLALLGAPWGKEGILHRKHYWEGPGKRSKDKAWLQAFVVISAGQIRMFRFDGAGTSSGMGLIGGGDWTSNASSVGSISLTHALCSVMPPPGYSRDRPHCFVLTLPGGASYFFQAGTQDLVEEWVSTCNYWAARHSREPLAGGISNMEYGWNRCQQNGAPPLPTSPKPNESQKDDDPFDSMSIKSGKSTRSTRSRFWNYQPPSSSPSSWLGEKTSIVEWSAPSVPPGESRLGEEAQLEALKRHLSLIRGELAAHNALQAPMKQLYGQRSPQGLKALANWKRKSAYLMSETTKYQTYVDALVSAVRLRGLRRGQKEVEDMLAAADEVDVAEDEEEAERADDESGSDNEEQAAKKRAEALRALEKGTS